MKSKIYTDEELIGIANGTLILCKGQSYKRKLRDLAETYKNLLLAYTDDELEEEEKEEIEK